MAPAVSIVMRSYNHADFIGLAIESVLAQSYRDWELIIVDDVSTDQSWSVIQGFRDERIRALRVPGDYGIGGSRAYNKALDLTSGHVIMNLDCDDEYRPDKVKKQLDSL
ncbi:MAG: glycosyltransferase family 2 protein, partial [Actinobacteria bacterium]|nr:glycosyltransferase family 2 protein [Actinomycetota bacterium]